MFKLISGALGPALAALAALSAGPALADKPPPPPQMLCFNFASALTGYDDCIGLDGGNTSVAGANEAFAADPTYAVEYKDNQTGAGSNNALFDLLDNGNQTVTLEFLQDVGDGSSTAVIALKFGGQGTNQLGYFRFDFADFDIGELLTFSWDPSFTGDGISHASLFSNSTLRGPGGPGGGHVPEPATYSLMLAGLAAAGYASRRRRRE